MGRGFGAFGFMVCLQAMTWACSSRISPAAAHVPRSPDRTLEPPSTAASTPVPPPATSALGPETGSVDCALLAEPGEPIETVALSDHIDPSNAPRPSNESEQLLFRQLYETLVRVDCHGRARPGLAASWQ